MLALYSAHTKMMLLMFIKPRLPVVPYRNISRFANFYRASQMIDGR